MQNNVETQHKHMYSIHIGSLCNIVFPMARFTCIVTSFTRESLNAMKHSIEFCLLPFIGVEKTFTNSLQL